MTTREEINEIEMRAGEHQQKVRKAQEILERLKQEAEEEIKEITAILPKKLTLPFLGDFENEKKEASKEIAGLKAKMAKAQDFLTKDYPLIKKELEAEMLRRVDGQAHLPSLRAKIQAFDIRLKNFKEDIYSRSPYEREQLLKLAEEMGELEEAKAQLEKFKP